MANNDKKKSLLKDIAIVSTIWGPLLFIIIGGIAWRNGSFDGTIMERLFPAMFFGFLAAFAAVIILSNLFKNSTLLWGISAIIIFIATVLSYMLGLTTILIIGAIALGGGLCLLALIRWIFRL